MKLIKLGPNSFAVRKDKNTYVGGTLDVFSFLTKECDVKTDEAAYAFSELRDKDHNVAQFGITRTFIFTSKINLGIDPLDTIELLSS